MVRVRITNLTALLRAVCQVSAKFRFSQVKVLKDEDSPSYSAHDNFNTKREQSL